MIQYDGMIDRIEKRIGFVSLEYKIYLWHCTAMTLLPVIWTFREGYLHGGLYFLRSILFVLVLLVAS